MQVISFRKKYITERHLFKDLIIDTPSAFSTPNKAPSLFKLGACLFYETLVLIALAFVSACLFVGVFGDAMQGYKRLFLQLFIWIVIGVYFVASWVVRGQTLAMRSWKLKLIDIDTRQAPALRNACLRYVLASVNLACFGIGYMGRFMYAEKQFLQDKWLNTAIIETLKEEAV